MDFVIHGGEEIIEYGRKHNRIPGRIQQDRHLALCQIEYHPVGALGYYGLGKNAQLVAADIFLQFTGSLQNVELQRVQLLF